MKGRREKLVERATSEILSEARKERVEQIKDRLREIACAKAVLRDLLKSFHELVDNLENATKEDARLLDPILDPSFFHERKLHGRKEFVDLDDE